MILARKHGVFNLKTINQQIQIEHEALDQTGKYCFLFVDAEASSAWYWAGSEIPAAGLTLGLLQQSRVAAVESTAKQYHVIRFWTDLSSSSDSSSLVTWQTCRSESMD